MERIEPVEPGPFLPLSPSKLDPSGRDSAARLGAEHGIGGGPPLPELGFVPQEPLELPEETVGHEDVTCPATRCDLGPDADPGLGPPVPGVDVADVKAHDLGKTQAGAE